MKEIINILNAIDLAFTQRKSQRHIDDKKYQLEIDESKNRILHLILLLTLLTNCTTMLVIGITFGIFKIPSNGELGFAEGL